MSKLSVFGVRVNATDYRSALDAIVKAAWERRPFGVTALAVHGLMTAMDDPDHLYRVNHLELVTPDGQPVRWFLNLKHKAGLRDRVYGPALSAKLLQRAALEQIPVYFYGSTPDVIAKLTASLRRDYPGLIVAGAEPSRFRCLSASEKDELVGRVLASGARILFVGLGCPRQEVFAYECKEQLSMPVLAVGAAFDYLSGNKNEPPSWMQAAGLQWLFRLCQEPRRLFYRYAVYNSRFVYYAALDLLRIGYRRQMEAAPISELRFG